VFERVWETHVLGEWMATHTVNVRQAVDAVSTVVQTLTKAATAATVAPLEARFTRQEFNALQLTVDESSTTEGFRISGMVFEVGIEPRGLKPQASAQMMA